MANNNTKINESANTVKKTLNVMNLNKIGLNSIDLVALNVSASDVCPTTQLLLQFKPTNNKYTLTNIAQWF